MKHIKHVFQLKQAGNALSEYCLSALLGVSLVIIGLSVLGQSISHLLNNSTSKAEFNPTLVLISKPNGTGASAATTTSFMTAQGATIEVEDSLKGNLGELVLTSGANGATNLLAENIVSVANQLKSSGDITDDQYNLLINLSNQGHRLAQIEGLLEQAASKANGGVSYSQVPVQLDGKTYPLTSVVDMIGWKGTDGNTGDAVSITNYAQANPETLTFMQLRDQVLQINAISNNPELMALLDSTANNILSIARASSGAAQWAQIDGTNVNTKTSYSNDITAILQSNLDMNSPIINTGSQASHADSQVICTTGKGQDTGQNCH